MANVQSSPEGNYSFFVHSDPNMSSESTINLENSNLPKQKRRRTSPRDHAILEAAYLRNSKPDKHERADIVSQVELGEKEVQIWFQNRRQNDRRKSKPLQPHELLAHLRNGAASAHSIQQKEHDEEGKEVQTDSNHVSIADLTRPSSRSSSIHELLNPPRSVAPSTSRTATLDNTQPQDALPTPPSSFEHPHKSDVKSAPTSIQRAHPGNNEPSHSRKRSHEVMANSSNTDVVKSVEASSQPSQVKALSRSSSFVRLAMTVDGAVKVKTNNEPTPSPPKKQAPPPEELIRKRESFGRSQSAVESGFDFKDINPPIRRPGAAGFGRSRDARTWEFYCDRDSGDALSTQAEAERSGSAVGAINLIRSRSQRNKIQALSPNPAKQNTRHIRLEQQHGKPKLSRTMSSMARLQSLDHAHESADGSNKRAKHDQSPSGDSDKENWAPGTRSSRHTMRRMQPSAPRDSILQENDFPSAREPATSNKSPTQAKKHSPTKEKAKGDDLDCIHGLLSLSQGAWR